MKHQREVAGMSKATSSEETTQGPRSSSILEAIQRLRQEEQESRAATAAPGARVTTYEPPRTEDRLDSPAAASEIRGREAAPIAVVPHRERRSWFANYFGPGSHAMAM